MRITFLLILLAVVSLSACTPTEPVRNSAEPTPVASNTSPEAETPAPLQPKSTPKIETSNEAPTLSPVVIAYCRAMKAGNDAALRQTYSRETVAALEKEMRAEGKDSLTAFLAEVEPINDVEKCGARNEKIDGDTAVAEIRTENMPNGLTVKFVRENGRWRLTTESPDLEKR